MGNRLKPLIGISGAAGSGKDTLARGIAMQDVYMVYHLADPIKAALNAMFGWGMDQWNDREWKEARIPWLSHQLTEDDVSVRAAIGEHRFISPRYLAQTLGTEWGRQAVDRQLWLKIAQQKYAKINTEAKMIGGRIMGMGMIVPDIRFENEAQWIKDAGGIMLHVERPDLEQISESSHASEAGFDPALIDDVIYNDGPPSKMIAEGREKLWESSGLSAEHAPLSLV